MLEPVNDRLTDVVRFSGKVADLVKVYPRVRSTLPLRLNSGSGLLVFAATETTHVRPPAYSTRASSPSRQ